MHYKQIRVPI
ncbi:hypothetical protein VCHENC02_4336A, partial [Vibrio harveyi]